MKRKIFLAALITSFLLLSTGVAFPEQYDKKSALAELKRAVNLALEYYSNVHRGEGQHSMVSTELFERARSIVRDYLGVGDDYQIIFGSPRGIDILVANLKKGAGGYKVIYSDRETGLRFGVAALAVKRERLPDLPPVVGGGEVDDVDDDTVAWSDAPAKFEPGTPNITGSIMFAKALGMMKGLNDKDIFRKETPQGRAKNDAKADTLEGLNGVQLLSKFKEVLVGRAALVPSEEGMVRYINLDNGASTPTFAPIMNAAFDALRETDEAARKIISDAKAECHAYFGAPEAEYDCIFTLNTTESINIAAEIAAKFREDGISPVIVGTDLEHNSNELPWRSVALLHAPVDRNGFIDLAALERILKEYNERRRHGSERIRVVTVSGASNVLGTFNDIGAISDLAHKYGAYIHVDGAQLAAHREVKMGSLGIDLFSCSGHKMYAPFGSGCLIARRSLMRRLGEDGLKRARDYGERNLMGIAAMRSSMRILKRIGLDTVEKEERILTARLLRGLSEINKRYGGDTITVFGIQDSDNLSDKGPVVSFHVDDIPHNIVAARLAEIRGIGVRNGCFCAHRLLKFLFDARGKDVSGLVRQGKEPGLVRASIGLENTAEEIDEFIGTLTKIVNDPDNKKYISSEEDCRYCAATALVPRAISKRIDEFVRDVVGKVYDIDPASGIMNRDI